MEESSKDPSYYVSFECIESIFENECIDADIVDFVIEIMSLYMSSKHYNPISTDKEIFISGATTMWFRLNTKDHCNTINHIEINRKIPSIPSEINNLEEDNAVDELKNWFENVYSGLDRNCNISQLTYLDSDGNIFFHCPYRNLMIFSNINQTNIKKNEIDPRQMYLDS